VNRASLFRHFVYLTKERMWSVVGGERRLCWIYVCRVFVDLVLSVAVAVVEEERQSGEESCQRWYR